MAATEDSLRQALTDIQSTIDARCSTIRQLKSSIDEAVKALNALNLEKTSIDQNQLKSSIDEAVKSLNALKLEKKSIENQLKASVDANGSVASRLATRKAVVDTLLRTLFYEEKYAPVLYEIYEEDVGPRGALVEYNVLQFWRQHFVYADGNLDFTFPLHIPKAVLKASGHVDKFNVNMVKDKKVREWYRADHVVKDFCMDKLENDLTMSAEKDAEFRDILKDLDHLSGEKLGAIIKENGIVAPETKNPLSDPYQSNLMHELYQLVKDEYGETCYWRPELAPGIYMKFKEIYNFSGRKVPLGAAEIGHVYIKKIYPRVGMLGVRAFSQAELVHFMDPDDKTHLKFSEVSNLEFLMFPRAEQESKEPAKRLCLAEVVQKGIVDSQTLAYFMGRVYLFLTSLGIDEKCVRFRQRLEKERADYVVDWWDAEIECSYGWIECVGIADRSDHDLTIYSKISGVKFAVPKEVKKLVISPIKKKIGKIFKGSQQRMVVEALKEMNEKMALDMKVALETKGEAKFPVCKLDEMVTIKKNMVLISEKKVKVPGTQFIPHAMEARFRIGRIIYCLYEHSFYTRLEKEKAGDEPLNVFRFDPRVAPYKCAIFLVDKDQRYEEIAEQIDKSLYAKDIMSMREMYMTGLTGLSIDKKYAKADELGVPFVLTVESTTSVTIRERDSTDRVSVKVDEVVNVIEDLSDGQCTWSDILRANV